MPGSQGEKCLRFLGGFGLDAPILKTYHLHRRVE